MLFITFYLFNIFIYLYAKFNLFISLLELLTNIFRFSYIM